MPPKGGTLVVTRRWFLCKDAEGDDEFVIAEQDPAQPEKWWIKEGGTTKLAQGVGQPANPVHQDGVPDNTMLMHLTEPGLLHNIRVRYERDMIYSYTAYILIAVNPYKRLNIYTDEILQSYRGKAIGVLEPHVFAVADRAYRAMKTDRKSQSVLISGESGAGKTETSKIVMKFLVKVGGKTDTGSSIEDRIMKTNPIMESIGNAKTIRNNNSSRFGKFMEIHFSDQLEISGAIIVTYLLEKSRIVQQSPNERNYHIFYQLCAGMTGQERADLDLMEAEKFDFINGGKACKIADVDDEREFQDTRTAMTAVGLDNNVQTLIWQMLAGVLHLGNIQFKNTAKKEDVFMADDKAARIAAKQLSVDYDKLQEALISRKMTTRAGGKLETTQVNLKLADADALRDSLAKAIYGKFFDWIVARINDSLRPTVKTAVFIGILDIFGFECFTKNSFEQLCINFTNERLQRHFNENIFIQEADIYKREGVPMPKISYEDNQDTLDLIEGKKPVPGILPILDEEMKMPGAKDENFCTKIYQIHYPNAGSKHKRLEKPKIQVMRENEGFIIRHYAGAVCYTAKGFLDKNNDNIHPDHEGLMIGSHNSVLKGLFYTSESSGQSTGPNTGMTHSIGGDFTKSLRSLMENLAQTDAHFIRCIKPNQVQKPQTFDGPLCLTQLRCNGMVAAVTLMHGGYPTRCPYIDLYDRFKPMLPPTITKLAPPLFCEALLMGLEVPRDDFALGLTRLFFRSGKLAFIEDLRSAGTQLPPEVVAKLKKWLCRKYWRKAIWTVLAHNIITARLMQHRSLAQLRTAIQMSRLMAISMVRLAKNVRYNMMASIIQSMALMSYERKMFRKRLAAAKKIQKVLRGWSVRRKHKGELAKRREARHNAPAEVKEKNRQFILWVKESEIRNRKAVQEMEANAREDLRKRNEAIDRRDKELKEEYDLKVMEMRPDSVRAVVKREVDGKIKQLDVNIEKIKAEFRDRNEEQNTRYKAVTEALNVAKTQLLHLQTEHKALTKDNEVLTKQLTSYNEKINNSDAWLQNTAAQYAGELQILRDELTTKKSSLMVELEELERKNAAGDANLTSIESNTAVAVVDLQAQLTSLEKKKEQAHKDGAAELEAKNDRIIKLETEAVDMSDKQEAVQMKLSTREKILADIRNKHKDIESRLAKSVEVALDDLQAVKRQKAQLERQQSESLSSSSAAAAAAAAAGTQSNGHVDAAQESNVDGGDPIKQLEAQLVETTEEFKTIADTNLILESQVTELEGQLDTVRREATEAMLRSASMKRDRDKRTRRPRGGAANAASTSADASEANGSANTNGNSSSNHEPSDLEAQIEALKGGFKEANEKYFKVKSDMELEVEKKKVARRSDEEEVERLREEIDQKHKQLVSTRSQENQQFNSYLNSRQEGSKEEDELAKKIFELEEKHKQQQLGTISTAVQRDAQLQTDNEILRLKVLDLNKKIADIQQSIDTHDKTAASVNAQLESAHKAKLEKEAALQEEKAAQDALTQKIATIRQQNNQQASKNAQMERDLEASKKGFFNFGR